MLLGTTPSRGSRPVRCALAAASLPVLGLLLGGCADGAAEPVSEDTPVIGDDGGQWGRDQLAVIDTIDAYNDWYRDSLATAVDPRLDMRTLRRLVAEPYATELGKQVSIQQSTGLEMRGEHVYTPREVTVDGERATMVACWDSRDGDVVNTYAKPEETVKPAPPTVTTFTLESAPAAETGWKITRRTASGRC